jgi:hypothetical protein
LVKVATPLTVVAVTDSTGEPELFRSTVVVPALKVTIWPDTLTGDCVRSLT